MERKNQYLILSMVCHMVKDKNWKILIKSGKIMSREGIILEEILPYSEEILSPETTEGMKILLRSVVEEGTAQRAKELDRKVYGKTGTTNNFSDAWFIGFDDRLVVGVWVGRDNHKPIGQRETGASAALPIWIEFMKNIYY